MRLVLAGSSKGPALSAGQWPPLRGLHRLLTRLLLPLAVVFEL